MLFSCHLKQCWLTETRTGIIDSRMAGMLRSNSQITSMANLFFSRFYRLLKIFFIADHNIDAVTVVTGTDGGCHVGNSFPIFGINDF